MALTLLLERLLPPAGAGEVHRLRPVAMLKTGVLAVAHATSTAGRLVLELLIKALPVGLLPGLVWARAVAGLERQATPMEQDMVVTVFPLQFLGRLLFALGVEPVDRVAIVACSLAVKVGEQTLQPEQIMACRGQ